jgi:hypothetical protein
MGAGHPTLGKADPYAAAHEGIPRNPNRNGPQQLRHPDLVRTEYFFLRCPSDQAHAEDMVFAVSIDTDRPAFVINLESEVPRFFPPRALGGMAGIAEGIWRVEIRK